MPILTAEVENVFFMRWQRECLLRDCEEIVERATAFHTRLGEPIVYMGLIPVGITPPEKHVRDAMRDGTLGISDRCGSIHIVIEGHGMRRAIVRSAAAGILLATGLKGAGFLIHENAEQALHAAREKNALVGSIPDILRRARSHGVVESVT